MLIWKGKLSAKSVIDAAIEKINCRSGTKILIIWTEKRKM